MSATSVYRASKYAKDPVFREIVLLRSRLTYHLRNREATKLFSQDLVGYLDVPFSELYRYLEKQFAADMNWANYGKVWEVDHIVPLRTATSVEDVHLLFYYINLQPVPPVKNRPGGPMERRCNET